MVSQTTRIKYIKTDQKIMMRSLNIVNNSTTVNKVTKQWGGKIKTMMAISNNQLLYTTSDFGRVGVINLNPEWTIAKLKNTLSITYKYKSGTRLLTLAHFESFFRAKYVIKPD